MTEPLDVIDLTLDSPANKTLRSRKRKQLTVDSRINMGTLDQNVDIESVEIIDLDSITGPQDTTMCCVNDPSQRKVLVLTCRICFEELNSEKIPMTTHCGHIFCSQCLTLAMRNAKKCPTCMTKIRASNCTRLYF